MNYSLIKMNHYATYYFANILDGVLADPFSYLRTLNDFYGEGKIEDFAKPFQKDSAFHKFIVFIVSSLIDEGIENIDIESMQKDYSMFQKDIPSDLWEYEADNIKKLQLERYFNNYEMKYESFTKWLIDNGKDFISATNDDIYDYYNSFYETGEIQELFEKISNEVFSVMFLNRKILQLFNVMMANILSDFEVDDAKEENSVFFKKNGILRRTRIPLWAKKAVFYRDRGKCVICNKDLSGVLSLQNDSNFDHIVPLASGGLNDVTNLQLLCENCNKSKGHYSCVTSLYYEKWY